MQRRKIFIGLVAAPEGFDFLVIGHEGFGQVEAVGPNVTEVKPGGCVAKII